MERICNNCQLYDEKNGVCAVVVLYEAEKYELPVLPSDPCHWERVDREIQNELKVEIQRQEEPYFKAKLSFELDSNVEVRQVRAWSDGTNGFIEMPSD